MKKRLVLRRQILQPLAEAEMLGVEAGFKPVVLTDACTGQGCGKNATDECAPPPTDMCTMSGCTSDPP